MPMRRCVFSGVEYSKVFECHPSGADVREHERDFVAQHFMGLDHRFGQSASKMLRFRLDSRFRGNDKRLQSQRFFRHSRESGNPE